jgi:hypothetical protein
MSATIRQRAPSPGKGVEEKAALLKQESINEANEGKK